MDAITDQAAEWFTRHREEPLSAAERARFSQWLAESPVHLREYVAIAEMWGALHSENARDEATPEALLAAARDGLNVISLSARSDSKPPRHRRGIYRWAAAAVLLLVLGGVTTYLSSTWNHYETARGEQRSLVLPDGSVVQLNTLTRAVVRFDAARRRVELPEGEAFFRVAPDKSRPFEVVTPFAVVRAVGTEFNVYSRARNTRVAVLEGTVLVSPGREVTEAAGAAEPVTAHKSVSLTPRGRTNDLKPFNPELETAWIQRRLVFDAERLDQAIDAFNLYNRTQLRVEDPQLAAFRVSGVFNADDPGALVKYLEHIERATISRRDGAVVVLSATP